MDKSPGLVQSRDQHLQRNAYFLIGPWSNSTPYQRPRTIAGNEETVTPNSHTATRAASRAFSRTPAHCFRVPPLRITTQRLVSFGNGVGRLADTGSFSES